MKAQKQEKSRLITLPVASALENQKRQPRQAKPIKPNDQVAATYNKSIQALVTAMNEDLKANILPEIKLLKPKYIADSASVIWLDDWPVIMNSLLSAFADKWGRVGVLQSERIAAGTIRRVEAEHSKQFVESVNQAVGVQVFTGNSETITNGLDAARIANAKLIKNITDTHADRISNTIMENMRAGFAPSKIAADLQKQSGMSRRRAKIIARDQTAKLNGELTKLRNQQAGIMHFRWVNSGDGRVGDDHKRAAERDVGFGPGVYRWDKPPKEGIPGRAKRPNCRCTAASVFEWELTGI